MTAENKKTLKVFFTASVAAFEIQEILNKDINQNIMYLLHKKALDELNKDDTDTDVMRDLLKQMEVIASLNKINKEQNDLESDLQSKGRR
jgi:hypothetical protein